MIWPEPQNVWSTAFILYTATLGLFAPLLVICLCYLLIVIKVVLSTSALLYLLHLKLNLLHINTSMRAYNHSTMKLISFHILRLVLCMVFCNGIEKKTQRSRVKDLAQS